MTPFTAEFLGTALLILLGNGVVANVVLTGTKGNGGGLIVITTAWAFCWGSCIGTLQRCTS
jgi:glycerol uptake facilitator protein